MNLKMKYPHDELPLDFILYLLSVSMERGKREAFPLILPKESTVPESDVVDLIARAFAV